MDDQIINHELCATIVATHVLNESGLDPDSSECERLYDVLLDIYTGIDPHTLFEILKKFK